MGKFSERQTIIIHSHLLAWRKLLHTSEKYVSGVDAETGKYLSLLQFQRVEHYPELTGHWPAHILGRDFCGRYWMLPYDAQLKTKGPKVLI